MIYEIYSVYDNKVGAYLQPFFVRTQPEAIRSFTGTCQDKKHLFGVHPLDFSLHFMGKWNDENGEIQTPTTPEGVVIGTEAATQALHPHQLEKSNNG